MCAPSLPPNSYPIGFTMSNPISFVLPDFWVFFDAQESRHSLLVSYLHRFHGCRSPDCHVLPCQIILPKSCRNNIMCAILNLEFTRTPASLSHCRLCTLAGCVAKQACGLLACLSAYHRRSFFLCWESNFSSQQLFSHHPAFPLLELCPTTLSPHQHHVSTSMRGMMSGHRTSSASD